MASDGSTRVDAGMLIAFDGRRHRLIRGGSMIYNGNVITYVGTSTDQPVDEVVDLRHHIVAPGFVSLHGHLTDSPLTKSLLEDRGNKAFGMSGLYEFLTPIAKATTREMALAAGRLSVLEIVRSGVTTMVDLCTPLPVEMAEITGGAGVRAYLGPTVRSATWNVVDDRRVGYDWQSEEDDAKCLADALAFMDLHEGTYEGRVRTMMAPAQIDTCRPELLKDCASAARQRAIPIQIHASQSAIEFREILTRTGLSPVGYLSELGMLGPDLTIGHCLFIEGHSSLAYPGTGDLERLAATGTNVAHCPWVFGRRGQTMESLDRYLQAGVNVGLGLDTFPQSMLHEMRMAAVLGKVVDGDTEVATALDVFNAATLGGAQALGRNDLGRLSVGARADFVSYRTDTLSMSPVRDPLRNIVYSAQPSDIDRVVVDGNEVMVDGEVRGFDEAKLAADLQAAAEGLWASLPQAHPMSRTVDDVFPHSLQDWCDDEKAEV